MDHGPPGGPDPDVRLGNVAGLHQKMHDVAAGHEDVEAVLKEAHERERRLIEDNEDVHVCQGTPLQMPLRMVGFATPHKALDLHGQ